MTLAAMWFIFVRHEPSTCSRMGQLSQEYFPVRFIYLFDAGIYITANYCKSMAKANYFKSLARALEKNPPALTERERWNPPLNSQRKSAIIALEQQKNSCFLQEDPKYTGNLGKTLLRTEFQEACSVKLFITRHILSHSDLL